MTLGNNERGMTTSHHLNNYKAPSLREFTITWPAYLEKKMITFKPENTNFGYRTKNHGIRFNFHRLQVQVSKCGDIVAIPENKNHTK